MSRSFCVCVCFFFFVCLFFVLFFAMYYMPSPSLADFFYILITIEGSSSPSPQQRGSSRSKVCSIEIPA